MTDVATAVLALKPDAEISVHNEDVNSINWLDGNPTGITVEQIQTKQGELQAEFDASEYRRLRAPEYPPIGDQLDALLKHLNYRRTQGDELIQELDDIIGEWLSTKQKFPKG